MEELLEEFFKQGDLALKQSTDLLNTIEPISPEDLAKARRLGLVAATWFQAAKLLNAKLKELGHYTMQS